MGRAGMRDAFDVVGSVAQTQSTGRRQHFTAVVRPTARKTEEFGHAPAYRTYKNPELPLPKGFAIVTTCYCADEK